MSAFGRDPLPQDEPGLSESQAGLHAELSGRREVGERHELPERRADLDEVPDWMGRSAWVVSGALAATLVLALVIWEPERYAEPQAAESPGAEPSADDRELSPTVVHLAEARVEAGSAVERDGSALPAAAPLREGDELVLSAGACLRIEPGLRACAPVETRVTIYSLARAQRVLGVREGRLWATLPADGEARLVVRHQGVRAAAERAAFAFVAEKSQPQVWVARGEVEVSRQTARAQLAAGQGLRFDEASGLTVFELQPSHQRRVQAMQAMAEGGPRVPRPPASAPARAAPSGTKAVGRPHARSLRPSAPAPGPASAPGSVSPSDPAPAQSAGSSEASAEADLASVAVDAASRAGEASSPARAPAESSPSKTATPAQRAFARVEALLGAGDFEAAEQALEALLVAHADTPVARRASVVLGDVRLEQLGDNLGALGAYRTYLEDEVPGRLDERARLGVIEALRRLHRFAHERKAIEEFVARYPGSPRVPKLEARRCFLGGS